MSGVTAACVGGGSALAYFSADPIDASKTTISPANATATVTFKRDGSIVNHAATVLGYWTDKRSATVGDSFKVKFTRSSGSAFSAEASANDTYTTDISTDRSFSQTETTDGFATRTCTGTWTVANLAATQTDTAAGTVTATVDV